MQSGGRDWIRLWALPVLLAGVALAFDGGPTAGFRSPSWPTGPIDEKSPTWPPEVLVLLALACFIDAPLSFLRRGVSSRPWPSTWIT